MLNPYTSTLIDGDSDGLGGDETYDFATRGRRGIIAFHNVSVIGNGRSYVDAAAVAVPVTVVAATNDTFKYNTEEFTIAPGTYNTLAALATAIGAATKAGPIAFSTLVTVSVVGTHLRFTSVPTGVNVKAFAVGTTDGLVAVLGITAAWTIAHTKAAGADGAYSATLTLQGKDEASGTYYDILASAVQTDVSDRVLQIHPFMAAVANLCATSQLPEHIRIKITRTTTNVITRTLAIQLTA